MLNLRSLVYRTTRHPTLPCILIGATWPVHSTGPWYYYDPNDTEASLSSSKYKNLSYNDPALTHCLNKRLFHSTIWSTLTDLEKKTNYSPKCKTVYIPRPHLRKIIFLKKHKPSRAWSPLGQMAFPCPNQVVWDVYPYIKHLKNS